MSIVHVAKQAGVSNTTVSRVINKHPSVAPETHRIVQAAMKELGFVVSERRPGPKPNSRHPRKSKAFCFLVRGVDGPVAPPGFIALLQGVEATCASQGIVFSIKFVNDEAAVAKSLMQESPDGILLHGEFSDGELSAKLSRMPCVWLMANPKCPTWGDQVMPNNEAIGELAANYLVGKKHGNLVFINLSNHFWALRKRQESFERAARALGTTVNVISEKAPSLSDNTISTIIENAVDRVARLQVRPTGIFIADDRQMSLLHPVLLRKKLISQHKVDLISCNNETSYIRSLDPQTATMDIQFEMIARFGVQSLIWRITNPTAGGRIISTVEPKLIPIES